MSIKDQWLLSHSRSNITCWKRWYIMRMIDICRHAQQLKRCTDEHLRRFDERPGKLRGDIPIGHMNMFQVDALYILCNRSSRIAFNIHNGNYEAHFNKGASLAHHACIGTGYSLHVHTYPGGF